jgi:iron complex outermembrane recepter protein
MAFKRLITRVFFIFLVISINVYAEETKKDKNEFELEEIVVAATKTEMKAALAPGDFSIVTSTDLEIKNIQTVDQALDGLPGVYHLGGSVTNIGPDISMRGIPRPVRTLFMMDGIPLNHPQFGHLLGFGKYEPEVVKRIEVVKGPFSSLYGGHAMGGAIDIITKMPEKRELIIKSGFGSSWQRGEADDDLFKRYISYGDMFNDKISIFLSYGRKNTNGFPIISNIQGEMPPAGITGWTYTTDSMGNPAYLIGDKGDCKYWDENITLKTMLNISENSNLILSYFRNRFDQHYDVSHTFLVDGAGNPVWSYGTVQEASFFSWQDFNQTENIYNMTYETQISNVKLKLQANHIQINESHKFTDSGTTHSGGGTGVLWDHPVNDRNRAELQLTFPLFTRQLIIFGGSFETRSGESDENQLSNFDDENSITGTLSLKKGKDKTSAFFVQDEITILDNLIAYFGFREDWWETYDGYVYQLGVGTNYSSKTENSFSPKVALVYKLSDRTTLKASAGKAFRPPTIYELYSRWVSPTGLVVAGNPSLKPETTKSWDIGAEHEVWEGGKIKATYFEDHLDNFIYLGMAAPLYLENQNAGKAESKGIELEAEQNFSNWLRLFANFTYTDSKIKENFANPTIVGKKLTMIPEKMFNIGGELIHGPLSASLTGRYVSKIYINDNNSDTVNHVQGSCDPYFVTDAKIAYNIMKFTTLSLSVNNIFDKNYYLSTSDLSYKAPGRSWFIDVMFRF